MNVDRGHEDADPYTFSAYEFPFHYALDFRDCSVSRRNKVFRARERKPLRISEKIDTEDAKKERNSGENVRKNRKTNKK
jgi:hypothetical protein